MEKDNVIDVEAYAKEGKTPPKDAHYKIRVDKVVVIMTISNPTGEDILKEAGFKPEEYRLDLKMKGGETRKIGLTDTVDLTDPGVERFMTIPLDQTEG